MRNLSQEELRLVAGGGEICPPPPTGPVRGNNGWGNGEDAAPGNSLAHQPKFEDGNTGASPSNSGASGDGNR